MRLRFHGACLFLVPFLTMGWAASPKAVKFLQPETVGNCTSIAEADFNSDGNLDLACVTDSLTIWMGNGQGLFTKVAQTLALSNAHILAGDFNRDGHPDVIVAGSNASGGNQIALLPGVGDGTFGKAIIIAKFANSFVSSIVEGDLNLDGKLDLAAAIFKEGGSDAVIKVFLGNGDGTFAKPVVTGSTAANFTNIALADFNLDGIPDIASFDYFNQTNTLEVVLGKGGGLFNPPVQTGISIGPSLPSFVIADFTGDGLPDAAVSDGSNIYVFNGNGAGSFVGGQVTTGQTGMLLLAIDLNGDGTQDLVMSGMGIALNQGAGVFGPVQWYQNQSGQGGVAGDFRHLGRPDLVVAGDVYLNNGDATFHDPLAFAVGCGDCWNLATGDFHNSGNLDAAAVSGHALRIYTGTGGGNFSGFQEFDYQLSTTQSIAVAAVADFNRDGNLDLALGIQDSNTVNEVGEVGILLGNGDGTFGNLNIAFTGKSVLSLIAADFNRDGRMDLAVGATSGGMVMLGDGAGNFTSSYTAHGLAVLGTTVSADFNGDGIPDLATSRHVYLGKGDGTFHHAFDVPGTGTYVLQGDFNHDGKPDLVTLDSGNIYLWPGLGNGTFGPSVTVATAPTNPLLVAADLNGDGIPDIVVGAVLAPSMIIYLSKGDGTFTAEPVGNLPQLSNLPVAADMNNDGHLDLLLVDADGLLMALINITS